MGATNADNVIGISLALQGLHNEALQVFGKVLIEKMHNGKADFRQAGKADNSLQH